ncbi:MAG: hypothetical protein MUF47_04785 [Porphyrobacter sp.]|jgi:hypothetical protein|nr:hypothetical protein [Porphyrobacter sp.]
MSQQKPFERWTVLPGGLMLIAAPAMVFLLARQGIAPTWLASAIAAVMTMVGIALIVRRLPLQRDDRST